MLTESGKLQVGGERARTLLAALALHPSRVVSADSLLEAIWGDAAPRTATHALHVHVSNLRHVLPPDLVVEAISGGYRLAAGPSATDVGLFRQHAAKASYELGKGRATAALAHLRTALESWRGAPLADVPWERFAGADVQQMEEMHRVVQEDLVEALLLDGRPEDAAGEAETLVRTEPFRERRWGQLILALYRAGRQAEALERWMEVRALLADQLGVEPGPQIQELVNEILRHDAALGVAVNVPSPKTRFASGSAGRVAYQVIGDGPTNVLVVPGFGGNLEIRWEDPGLAGFYRRLARSTRVIIMDRRGTGLSDRDGGIPPIEAQADDLLTVLDDVGAERSALFGVMDGGAIALRCAAVAPDRVTGVVTYATWPAWHLVAPSASGVFDDAIASLDDGLCLDPVIALMAPSRVDDPVFSEWFGRYVRLAAGGGGTAAAVTRFREVDVLGVLGRVESPVLAMSRANDRFIPPECARTIAAGVRHGRTAFLPGEDSVLWADDVDGVATTVEDFLEGLESG